MSYSFNRAKILAKVESRCRVQLDKAAADLQTEMKVMLSRRGTGRVYHRTVGGRRGGVSTAGTFRQASAPGEPPAVDTGALRRSIQIDRRQINALRVRVGTDKKVDAHALGRLLEYGTRYMAPRPWARPSRRLAKPKILARFKREVLFKGL